jgi:hypothetical protein
VNIPPITSINAALRLYYSHSELGNKEIVQLFGKLSTATIARLKNMVKDEMIKRDMLSYGMFKVNTVVAYVVWGLDVIDLEKRRKKLKELDLLE